MRVYIWCDGAAMPTGGPAGAGSVCRRHLGACHRRLLRPASPPRPAEIHGASPLAADGLGLASEAVSVAIHARLDDSRACAAAESGD